MRCRADQWGEYVFYVLQWCVTLTLTLCFCWSEADWIDTTLIAMGLVSNCTPYKKFVRVRILVLSLLSHNTTLLFLTHKCKLLMVTIYHLNLPKQCSWIKPVTTATCRNNCIPNTITIIYYTCSKQGCIKLIKSDSKCIFKCFPFIKPEKTYHSFHTNIKQHNIDNNNNNNNNKCFLSSKLAH